MIYRIRIDLAFTDKDPCDDILDKARDHLAQAIVINPDQLDEERGFITLEKCYHDENPARPCEVIEHLEVED